MITLQKKMQTSFLTLLLVLGVSFAVSAQIETGTDATGPTTEAGGDADHEPPLDDIVKRAVMEDRFILKYANIREHDIMWEKRIWRVLDVNELMNNPFKYPEAPFINILLEGAESGEIRVYQDEEFKNLISGEEVASIGSSVDTVWVMDPVTYEEIPQVVSNVLNPDDIQRYRIKEVWYFDSQASMLRVRILGIAPLKKDFDEAGNFRWEAPIFWIYYPHAREFMAKQKYFNPFNDASPLSWEDIFEMRFFSSYISKESNVRDYRLEDFGFSTGIDLLIQSQKIEDTIFNFEQDLWSY